MFPQFFLAGEIKLISTGEYGLILLRQRKLHESIFLCSTQEYADRCILVVSLHIPIEIIHIHLHLTQILVGKTAYLEIDKDIAPKDAIVEHEIDIEMFIIERETLLASLKEKTLPKAPSIWTRKA